MDRYAVFALGVREGGGQEARERCVRVGRWGVRDRRTRQEVVGGGWERERCVRVEMVVVVRLGVREWTLGSLEGVESQVSGIEEEF